MVLTRASFVDGVPTGHEHPVFNKLKKNCVKKSSYPQLE